MADAKISQLPVATTPLAGTELVPVVQGGVTDQTTVEAILTGTVPSGTANGVLYLDGSKVVTSGSALTFDGSNFFGGTNTYVTGRFYAQRSSSSLNLPIAGYTDGSAGAVLTGAKGDIVAFGNAGGDGVIFANANTEAMRLTSTGLGIGTSSPAQKLDVYGSAGAAYIQVQDAAGLTGKIQARASTGLFEIGTTSNNGLALYTNNTEKVLLDSSGNLGLGVTPSAWASSWKAFQIDNRSLAQTGSGAGDWTMAFNAVFDSTDSRWEYQYTGDSAVRYSQTGAGVHAWYISTDLTPTAGNPISFTQAMTLDASGNLGVGATTAGGKLHVRTSAGAVGLILDANASDSNSDSPVIDFRGEATQGQGCRIAAVNTNTFGRKALVFYTSDTASNTYTPTERARITSGGNFVVGTAALATTATDGFLYVPTCAGTPTGTPTTQTGTAPIVVDTTNNKLYFYSGGQWRDAGP